MATARYLVQLSVSSLSGATVSKEVRRADEDRAVSFAQTWLAQSRRSGRYFTTWYDQWRVSRIEEDKGLCLIATGVATDSESERLHGGKAAPKAVKKRGKTGSKQLIISTRMMPNSGKATGLARLRSVTPARTQSNHPPRPGSAREHFQAMVDRAKRELAARGNVLPMGSSEDSQS